MMTILEQQYFLQRSAIADEKTRVKYRRAVIWLGEMLGRPARLDDLTDANLAGVMQWLSIHRGQCPTTINMSRKCLVAFWRWLRNVGLVSVGPTVPPLKVAKRTPRAMSADELRRLVQAALDAPGRIGSLPAGQWWLTLFALEFSTGARASELLAMRWEWLDLESGWLRVPAECRKGKAVDMPYHLTPDVLQWLAPLRRPSGLILGFDLSTSRYYQLYGDLLQSAELPDGRRNKTQALRRTFATLVALGGGDASAALGHSNPAIARECYVDPTATQARHSEFVPASWRPLTLAAQTGIS